MSWLPPAHRSSPRELRPWKAPALVDRGVDLEGLTYMVVDEIVGDTVGVSLSPWPAADPAGRLRFRVEEDPVHVGVDIHTLCDFLRHERGMEFVPISRSPTEETRRELRIGTVFAAEIKKARSKRWARPLDRYVGRIFDITFDAREVAKLAHYGALTERWSQKKAEKLRLAKQTP